MGRVCGKTSSSSQETVLLPSARPPLSINPAPPPRPWAAFPSVARYQRQPFPHPFEPSAPARQQTPAPSVPTAAQEQPLDYSKPIYTDPTPGVTIACPLSILANPTIEPSEVRDLFTTFFHRKEKATALGCAVWRSNPRVYAQELTPVRGPQDPASLAMVGLTPGVLPYFTIASFLHN